MNAQQFPLNIEFDDKDAVKAKFNIKWSAPLRIWYAEDADVAEAAQALADELSGNRHFIEMEREALFAKLKLLLPTHLKQKWPPHLLAHQ